MGAIEVITSQSVMVIGVIRGSLESISRSSPCFRVSEFEIRIGIRGDGEEWRSLEVGMLTPGLGENWCIGAILDTPISVSDMSCSA